MILPFLPMDETEASVQIEGEVMFRRDPKSKLMKAVSGTEWMYRRGAMEKGRRVCGCVGMCV